MSQELQSQPHHPHEQVEPPDDPAGMFGIVSGAAFGVISGFMVAGAVSVSVAGCLALCTGLMIGWKAAGWWWED